MNEQTAGALLRELCAGECCLHAEVAAVVDHTAFVADHLHGRVGLYGPARLQCGAVLHREEAGAGCRGAEVAVSVVLVGQLIHSYGAALEIVAAGVGVEGAHLHGARAVFGE